MTKRVLILTGVILLLGVSLAVWWSGPDQAPYSQPRSAGDVAAQAAKLGWTSPVAAAPAEPLPLSRPVRLAIGGLGLADNDQNAELGDLVTADLSGAPGFVLVERPALKTILDELHLNWSGFVRAGDAVRAGRLLKADWFLLGTVAKINDTNSLVVRVVDARTGILRDAACFPADQPFGRLAAALAAFTQQCRQNAAHPTPHVYLAIGSFGDLGVNNRQAAFPAQLRGYLTAAYQNGPVTLLEREYADILLEEVRLDLAGLTDEGGTNAPAPLQSAYWLVDGYYQSYETTNFAVEAVVNINRMFGRRSSATFRGPPDDPLFAQIKQRIDQAIRESSAATFISRITEARDQMAEGKEVLHVPEYEIWHMPYEGDVDALELARRRRNVEQAIRAFESVLLLEPDNREAKIYLAHCLRRSFIQRNDEARQYYREILDAPVTDRWTPVAREGLRESLLWLDAGERARWYATAAAQSPHSPAADFYRRQAETAAREAVIDQGKSPEAVQLAKERLLDDIRDAREFISHRDGTWRPNYGMDDFADVFQHDAPEIARQTAAFLPRMEAEFPELKPGLLAAVVTYQVDTNAPVIAEFQQTLAECVAHPDQIFEVESFWKNSRWSLYDWCFDKKDYALAVSFLEGERQTDRAGHPGLFDNQQKINLAYAYLALHRWQDALDIFTAFGGQPVEADGDGPWGRAFAPVLTDKMAAYCRQKMNQPSGPAAPEFKLDRTCLCLCSPSAFATDASGLWVAIADQLIHLDFNLRTNLAVSLPKPAEIPVTSLSVGDSKIWIGTAGAGLIEYDQTTRRCQVFGESAGLLMNFVSQLCLSGNTLWIGYGGSAAGGGFGRLQLDSHQFKSYSPPLRQGPATFELANDLPDQPPRQTVTQLATDPQGNPWLLVENKGLQRFAVATDTWSMIPLKDGQRVRCFAFDSSRLFEGNSLMQMEVSLQSGPPGGPFQKKTLVLSLDEMSQLSASLQTNHSGWRCVGSSGGTEPDRGVLEIQTLRDGRWQSRADAAAMPNPPSALATDGANLWIGGEGYLARLDLKDYKIRKLCSLPSHTVDHIQIGGGYVWLEYDQHLHRGALNQIP